MVCYHCQAMFVMNNTKFSRELKTLIYYLQEYGIQHIDFKFNSLDSLPKEQVQIDQFMTQVHQGFFAAQDRTIYLLKKILQEQKRLKVSLANARRQHDKELSQKFLDSLNQVKFQERVLRKVMDGISIFLFSLIRGGKTVIKTARFQRCRLRFFRSQECGTIQRS